MQGHEMYIELNFLRVLPHIRCSTLVELKIQTIKCGDHSPRLEVMFMIFNFVFLELNIANSFHERDE
jgi:hypothetical protein